MSRGRMGERGQGARREHSREVVRQRMLHTRKVSTEVHRVSDLRQASFHVQLAALPRHPLMACI